MPAIKIECDACREETDDFISDYEGVVYCRSCGLKFEMNRTLAEYEEKREWVESVWLTKLTTLKDTAARAKEAFESYERKNR